MSTGMRTHLPRPAARFFIAAALLISSVSAVRMPPAPAAAPAGETPTAWAPEVRLRKLHLVRPDLIPYPIAYEVVC
jgi:hypothetical protein